MDPGSWAFFAFSDHFYILKDVSEAYSRRVRARIGGLKFDGLTYMPDAIQVAGKILSQRFDEQRFLLVFSDGWPYGYPDMPLALSEAISSLEKKGVIVIGVGLESERMSDFFKINCAVYSQKDLIKKFAKIYVSASRAALET
jgi:nitric oxide reductase activation protein